MTVTAIRSTPSACQACDRMCESFPTVLTKETMASIIGVPDLTLSGRRVGLSIPHSCIGKKEQGSNAKNPLVVAGGFSREVVSRAD